ncbi:MAG: CBS domain-containing protein [Bacteroidota bacterium]
MTTVRTILGSKGSVVYTVGPEVLVIDALRIMSEKNIGVLVVLTGTDVGGIFSERDYARRVTLHGRSADATPIAEVMTTGVVSVGPDESIDDCMALMTARHIRHLPVLQEGHLVGMISIGDVVKAIVSEREHTIQQLTNYITGSRA